MIGHTISHYKILEKLGSGGMGVVYKAEDMKLKRIVALKFLPSTFSFDEEATKRFIIEAQTASALQHNNICTIHDIDEAEDNRIFICMDYYEGETLKKKIESGPLETNEVVDIILQIAAGLNIAHEKGIIHRDIKPANIFITKDGVVKILDFGLAKLSGRTLITKLGSTLGTVAYMSPEQARGEVVDHRTDIWSLGIVMYEMLTGHLPFAGEYDQAVIYQILNDNPEPIQKLLPDLSSEYAVIVNRTMQKEPENRFQSTTEIIDQLRLIGSRSERELSEPSGLHTKNSLALLITLKKFFKKKFYWSFSIITIILLFIIYSIFFFNRSVELNPDMMMSTLISPYPNIGRPSMSADGNWIAFPSKDNNGMWDIYFMNTSGGEPRRITNDSSIFIPSVEISPDGSMIAYSTRRDRGSWEAPDLFVVSTLGGGRRMIVEKGDGPCWNPDGTRIFYTGTINGTMQVFSVKSDGTDRQMEFRDTLGAWDKYNWEHVLPWPNISLSVSPDGKSIVYPRNFFDSSITVWPYYKELVIHNLETGKEQQLTFSKKYIIDVYWSKKNMIIYSCEIDLWSLPANGGKGFQITKSVGIGNWGVKTSADDRKLIYIQSQSVCYLWRGLLTYDSNEQLTFDDRSKRMPRLSPDGKQLAFLMRNRNSNGNGEAIYLSDNNFNNIRQLTPFSKDISYWIENWSPDGKWISYTIFNFDLAYDSVGFSRSYIVSPEQESQPRFIAFGNILGWVNDTTICLNLVDSIWYQSVNSEKRTSSLLGDSLFIYRYVYNNRYVVYRDHHKGHEGIWIAATGPNYKLNGKPINLSALLGNSGMDYQITENSIFFLQILERRLWRIQFPSCKKEIIPWTFKGIGQGNWSVTEDGKEIYWSEFRNQDKLVVIENPFK